VDDEHATSSHGQARRRLMKALAASGGVFAAATIVPTRWTRPIIETIIVPLHAQGSPGVFVGLFTTASLAQQQSILDFVVPRVHAVTVGGNVNVGNASFDLAWDVGADNYVICGSGVVNSVMAFTMSGGGDRTGNQLENFSDAIPGGTLSITNQQFLSDTQLFFIAQYQSSQVKGVAQPGGGCFINSTSSLTLSSPYPDDNPA
jgi:hypothetical protein